MQIWPPEKEMHSVSVIGCRIENNDNNLLFAPRLGGINWTIIL